MEILRTCTSPCPSRRYSNHQRNFRTEAWRSSIESNVTNGRSGKRRLNPYCRRNLAAIVILRRQASRLTGTPMAWQKRGSFRASGSDGQTYTIDIWVDVLDAANSLDPNAKIDGLRSLRLKDGTRLNRVAQG